MAQTLAKKLLYKPGYRVISLGTPEGYLSMLESELADAVIDSVASDTYDFVLLFVKGSEELSDSLPTAISSLRPDGLLWIAYPKKSSKIESDLHRDILWAQVEPCGFTGVSLISLDETWSVMRFRPAEKVQSTRTGGTSADSSFV